MRHAIIGSRTFGDYEFMKEKLKEFNITHIVSGGARGADTLAKRYAGDNELKFDEFKPDYSTHGDTAPLVRNREIVNYSDEIIAFWDGKSTGTGYTLGYARKRGKKVHVFRYKDG